MRSLVLVSGLVFAALSPAVAQPAKPSVQLVPHRAIYDLSLLRSQGSRGLDSARGRIAMDFGGDACDGYTLNYRQVTVLNSNESGARTVDTQTATFEAGDGLSMRFKSTSTSGASAGSGVDGDAQLRPDGSLDVRFKQPKRGGFSAAGQPVFPTEHLKRVIEAARSGQTTVAVKVYDGSDDGKKIYDTLGVIGHKIEPGNGSVLDDASKQESLLKIARWPVSISYFAEGSADRVPAYTVSFELYENGISRALRLDYGDFVLKGDLQTLQIQPSTACQR
jgi:hypothetical protein